MAVMGKKGAAGGKPKNVNTLKRKAEKQDERKPVAGVKRKRTEYVVTEKKTDKNAKKRSRERVSKGISGIANFRFEIHQAIVMWLL